MSDFPPGSNTVFRIPPAYRHCQPDNFVWDDVQPVAARGAYIQFLVDVLAGGAPHLILTGPPGIGKTHLGVAAYRAAVVQYGTELVTWLNVPEFCSKVKDAYNSQLDPFASYAAACRMVVLDDLLGRDLSMHEASQIVYRLLDIAYQNEAAVLITMNPAVQELSQRFPPHEVSRILAAAKVIPMTAQRDRRRG